MKRRGPNPPEHLSDQAKTWWRGVVQDYVLEPHHLRLLQLAAEAWDRAQQARAVIDKEGITTTDDRKNVRAHPAVGIEKDARTGFARLVRELDLDVELPPNRSRPPGLRSNRRDL
ncbi:P27 family phage terminase small subunit [Mesorhizobium caraganae]|uniref:P27 family phage terminase small subunit n=1 Tax=Mesorhizobium caraganae TaxID=483206 RepID=UPI003ED1302F